MEQLLENVCLLLASRTRDVVRSALGFIKVAVVVMDVAHLAKHVQLVVSVPFPSASGIVARELPAETQCALRPASFKHFSSYTLSGAAEGHAGALEGTSGGGKGAQHPGCHLSPPTAPPQQQGLCRAGTGG